MAAKQLKLDYTELEGLGLRQHPETSGVFVLGKTSSPHSSGLADAEQALPCPWQLDTLELAAGVNGLVIQRLSLSLDQDILLQNLKQLAGEIFGNTATIEISPSHAGGIWVLAEVQSLAEDRSRVNLQQRGRYAVGGLVLRLGNEGQDFLVHTTEHFGLGELSPGFFTAFPELVARSFALPWDPQGAVSLFEQRYPFPELVRSALAGRFGRTRINQILPTGAVSMQANRSLRLEQDSGQNWRFMLSEHGELSQSRGLIPVLEVLEDRELRQQYGHLDRELFQGRIESAQRQLQRAFSEHPDSLYLLRRLLFLNLDKRQAPDDRQVQAALQAEPAGKLFISALLARAQLDKDAKATLKALSTLGKALAQSMPQFERLAVLELVLPEMLGDAWSSLDAARAYACYARVLQHRPEHPRILAKLVHLARELGEVESECSGLERLLKVEQRVGALAAIHSRLAELYEVDQGEQAVQHAQAALALLPSDAKQALRVSSLLVHTNRAQEAVQVLTQSLSQVALSAHDKAELEIATAKIWAESLGRSDLAKKRFDNAIALIDDDPALFAALEAGVRAIGHHEGVAALLERNFNVSLKNRDELAIQALMPRLVELYRHTLKEPARAWQLYQRMIAEFLIDPKEIAKILSWDEVAVDWREIYNGLSLRIQNIHDADKLGAYHEQLGQLARLRLQNREAAAQHFREALRLGAIEAGSWQFLFQHLASKQDYENLATCLQMRLEQVQGVERVEILRELVELPAAISEEQKDIYAVLIYQTNKLQETSLQKRFLYHAGRRDLSSLHQLLQHVVAEAAAPSQEEYWLNFVIDCLAIQQDPILGAALDMYYRRLLAICSEPKAVLLSAEERLATYEEYLDYYLLQLLALNIMPTLPEEQVLRVLQADPIALGDYYERIASHSPNKLLRPQHARTALNLLPVGPTQAPREFRLLAKLLSMAPATAAEIERCLALGKSRNEWEPLAAAIRAQLQYCEDTTMKAKIGRQLLSIYHERLFDPQRALEAYAIIYNATADQAALQFEMADYARAHVDPLRAREYSLACLANQGCWQDLHLMRELMAALFKDGIDADTIRRVMIPQIDLLMQRGDALRAAAYGKVISDAGVNDVELLRVLLPLGAHPTELPVFLKILRQHLNSLSDLRIVSKVLGELELNLESLPAAIRIEDLARRLLRATATEALPAPVHVEVELFLGRRLFDREQNQEEAFAIFHSAYGRNPDEQRAWLPYYFLLRERSSSEAIMALLAKMIPLLETDDRLLRHYPITLESLKDDLQRLKSGLNAAPPPQSKAAAPSLSQSLSVSKPFSRLAAAPGAVPDAVAESLTDHFSEIWKSVMGPQIFPDLNRRREFPPNEDSSKAVDKIIVLNGKASFAEDDGVEATIAMEMPGGEALLVGSPSKVEVPEVPAAGPTGPGIFVRESMIGSSHLPFSVEKGLRTMLTFQPRNEVKGIQVLLLSQDGMAIGFNAESSMSAQPGLRSISGPGESIANRWREMTRAHEVPPGICQQVLAQAFTSNLEKHIALQCFALLSGDIEVLDSWQLRVWRHPEELSYQLSRSERMPKTAPRAILEGPLHELLKYLGPLLVKYFQRDFSLTTLATALNITTAEFVQHRKLLPWDDAVLARVGLHRYKDTFDRHHYTAFTLRGLGKRLFFDGKNRALYFDALYYGRTPPTHLFHRVLGTLRASRLNHYVLLTLNPVQQVLPLLTQLRRVSAGVRLGKEQDDLRQALRTLDPVRLKDLLAQQPMIAVEDINRLYAALWQEIFSQQLAETLDLVGIIESVANLDVLLRRWQPLAILDTSAYARSLIDFASHLKL